MTKSRLNKLTKDVSAYLRMTESNEHREYLKEHRKRLAALRAEAIGYVDFKEEPWQLENDY